jgi:hypothetical protein
MYRFDLTKPCDNCPFRKDVEGYLTPARAEEIANDLERATFQCHKTTKAGGASPGTTAQHCAGALIAMAKSDRLGDMQQVAERLRLYDPSRLDLTAPVGTLHEFIEHHGGDPAKLAWFGDPGFVAKSSRTRRKRK